MFLDNSEWFLLGAFSILFLYFITHYFTKRVDKYNLYFAFGCLISIIRTITNNLYPVLGELSPYYILVRKIDHLSFVWGPMFYILLADSLFAKIGNKVIVRTFLLISIGLSMFIVFTPNKLYTPPYYFYDYVIIANMLYATYIFTIALIKKLKFSLLFFSANLIFIFSVVYDVLHGSNIITSPFGELHAYTYFIYLYITSVVLASKLAIIDKRRLESQVKFLHAQIQPHFLHNTISTIIAYCKKDPEQSTQLLIELSTYLRGKFKTQEDMFTPLKDEIELIKSYLAIEQARFKEHLIVEYDIDEECNILIPCLILQPIVENAVKHGLLPKKDGGKLSISIKRAENNVVAIIKDNGIGMDVERLPDILVGNETGIGLSNTNERLKRYYNTEIKAKSKLGKGTEFTITIPISKGKNNDKMYSGR